MTIYKFILVIIPQGLVLYSVCSVLAPAFVSLALWLSTVARWPQNACWDELFPRECELSLLSLSFS